MEGYSGAFENVSITLPAKRLSNEDANPFLERIGLPQTIHRNGPAHVPYHWLGERPDPRPVRHGGAGRRGVVDASVAADPGRVLVGRGDLTYLRRNRVQVELAETYGVSQSTISRAIAALTPALGRLLADHVPVPEDLNERRQYIVDGTLLPCWSQCHIA